MRIVDDATSEARRGSIWLSPGDEPMYRLPEFSEAEAERRSSVGKKIVSQIDALDIAALPKEVGTTVRIAAHRAALWSREADWWWLVCDPLRVGFFSLFAPTAYSGGHLLITIHKALGEYRFESAGDVQRYLALIADYGRLIDQFAERTRGQAERRIRMPRVQFDRAVALFETLGAAAPRALAVDGARLESARADETSQVIDASIRALVVPAFDRLLAGLDAPYRAAAPETVGMSQYPRGAEIYAELVRLHTTLPLSANEVHQSGIDRMRTLTTQKLGLAHEAGFDDVPAYESALDRDERWRAETDVAIGAVFRRSIDRIAPELAAHFHLLPSTGVEAVPLPREAAGSMTFGYYQQPTAAVPHGTYFFNGPNLSQRGLQNVAALTYHELMPGHHLHIGTQLENAALPELRARTLVNAFNEGWAEYAATLAGEMGMYATPAERYGRLIMDSFLTCRLVVDTGMNAFDWDLERAREYLREHSGLSEAEIASEIIRYSCDIPAQSLAYKIGDDYLVALREEMRARVGRHFDVRDFHAAVLGSGSRPYDMVAEDVREFQPQSSIF